MRHLSKTEVLGLYFSAVASPLLSGSYSVIAAAPRESEPENDGAGLSRAQRHLLPRIPMILCPRPWREAPDLPFDQKRDEPGTHVGMSVHSSRSGGEGFTSALGKNRKYLKPQ